MAPRLHGMHAIPSGRATDVNPRVHRNEKDFLSDRYQMTRGNRQPIVGICPSANPGERARSSPPTPNPQLP